MQALIDQYLRAKGAEDAAKAERKRLGDQIAAQLEHPEEGQKTHKVGVYAVTVKGGLNRRVDWEAFDAVTCEHPPAKVKRELDTKGLHWIRDNEPETYQQYLKTITTTPAAVQLTIKERNDGV